MKKAIAVIALMASFSICASAQSILKDIGDKAKQKVEKSVNKKVDEKIDQAVDGALNKLFGGSSKPADNSNSSQSYTEPAAAGFAQALYAEDGYLWEWEGDEDDLPTLPGNNLKDMISFIPELPDAALLVTEKGFKEFDKQVKTASKSSSAICSALMTRMSTYTQSSQISGEYSENERLEAIYEELINIQQAETDLMIARQQAAATNLLGALAGSNTQSLENGTLDGALSTLSMKMSKDWPKSEDCRKVNQMGTDKKNHKDQNAIIDAYNAKQMKKWIDTIKRYQEQDKASVMRLVAIEEELEGMSDADKANPYWSRSMVQLTQLANKVLIYAGYPSRALNCPMVRHTNE